MRSHRGHTAVEWEEMGVGAQESRRGPNRSRPANPAEADQKKGGRLPQDSRSTAWFR